MEITELQITAYSLDSRDFAKTIDNYKEQGYTLQKVDISEVNEKKGSYFKAEIKLTKPNTFKNRYNY